MVRYKSAVVDYDEALRLKPDCIKAYHNRGLAKLELRQYEDTIVDCNEAIRLKPDSAETYCNRGIAKYAIIQYEEAVRDYNEDRTLGTVCRRHDCPKRMVDYSDAAVEDYRSTFKT